jgi:hypothetical protein
MPDPKRVAPTDHAAHDLLLVAEAADRGGRLPHGLADCPVCATLHRDLIAIAAAAPGAAIPARPRDYTLTQADVERLRAPAWRRWLAGIGTPRDTVTRPLAIGLTTLGLAGLLITTLPASFLGLGSSASQVILSTVGAPIGGAAAASAAPAAPSMAPLEAPAAEGAPEVAGAAPSGAAAPATDQQQLYTGRDTSGVEEGAQRSSAADAQAHADPGLAITAESGPPSPLLVIAAASLLIGLGLFGLRWSVRRLGDG